MDKKISIVYIPLFLILLYSFTSVNSFKENQMKFSRVEKAYREKWNLINNNLKTLEINPQDMELYLRVFKLEKEIEVWAKNKSDERYTKVITYDICRLSGQLGPKRRQGDFQVPEGFYHINLFNPKSNYHLSLGINYPNKSDQLLGVKNNLGGDIFIHGKCVTIGSLPITNDKIKELYVYCVEAKNNGQFNIPVTIFPARLSNIRFRNLSEDFNPNKAILDLWTDLKQFYDRFEENKSLPGITFLNNGRHKIE
ncbi:hypothetical protein ES705_40798 [subsurface metagenome]